MRFSRIAALGAAALTSTLLLTGCTGSSGPAVTVIATGPAVTPSPTPVVTPPDTPTPTPADHFYTLDETWDLSPESQAQGSGCAPGVGQLPDGIWFGQVATWSTSQIAFDMECWWTGSGAEAEAASRGDEVNNDHYITNDATTVRVVTFATDAFGMKADVYQLSDTSTWVMDSVANVIADPGGTAPVDTAHPLVWVAVNGGTVTSVAVQYVP